MKLDKLWIAEFKNLKDFSVDLDEKSPVTVIIGWNGTGKSNLIEALAIIFRDLDLKQQTPFGYKIEFICHGNRVKIDNDPSRPPRERLRKEISRVTSDGPQGAVDETFPHLPSYVFGYYSGPTHRLREIFLEHQRNYYNRILNEDITRTTALKELQSLRRFFFAEDQHSKYVALAFFLKEDQKIKTFLREYMRIVGLESVLFIMKKPTWTSKEGDPRFWNARGLVQRFLDHLYSISLAPMRLTQSIPTGISYRVKREFLYLFVKDAETLSSFAQDYDSPSDFFASLESTDLSEVIYDVRINVRILNYDGTLTFRELSEGEQQLLMVLGLLRFTKQNESLILLDEPDTHLNPYWSTEYLDLLTRIVDDEPAQSPEQETRHIIMSTHDPLVIAGLEKQQIQIMKRNGETGRCYAEVPERSPRGMGFEGILTSDMFGFRSALDKPTLRLLDQKRRLAIKEVLSDEERFELERLNEQIGPLDFTNVVRDEYFNLFSRWMAQYEQKESLQRLVLEPDEYAARKEHAQKLAAQLAELKQKESE